MSESDVEIYIEALELRGLPAMDHHRVGDALARELATLLVERGIPAQLAGSGTIDRLDAGTTELNCDVPCNPKSAGQHVARAIYEGMNR